MSKSKKKKNKRNKKRHFIAPAPRVEEASVAAESVSSQVDETKPNEELKTEPKVVEKTITSKPTAPDLPTDKQLDGLVKKEIRTTAIIAGSIIIGLFLLWIIFEHTGLGSSVYNSVAKLLK